MGAATWMSPHPQFSAVPVRDGDTGPLRGRLGSRSRASRPPPPAGTGAGAGRRPAACGGPCRSGARLPRMGARGGAHGAGGSAAGGGRPRVGRSRRCSSSRGLEPRGPSGARLWRPGPRTRAPAALAPSGGPSRTVAADLTYTAFPGARWLRARYGAGPLPLLWIRYALHAAGWLAGAVRSPTSTNQELR